jgi:hypothetical protein
MRSNFLVGGAILQINVLFCAWAMSQFIPAVGPICVHDACEVMSHRWLVSGEGRTEGRWWRPRVGRVGAARRHLDVDGNKIIVVDVKSVGDMYPDCRCVQIKVLYPGVYRCYYSTPAILYKSNEGTKMFAPPHAITRSLFYSLRLLETTVS